MKNGLYPHLRTTLSAAIVFIAGAFFAPPAHATALPDGVLAGPIQNPANGHYYYVLAANTWTASEALAVSLGGHLVTINNSAEQDWVYGTFALYGGVNHPAMWIGLHYHLEGYDYDEDGDIIGQEGEFQWISGQPVDYTNWHPVQPDGSGDYGVMSSPAEAIGGFWDDTTDDNAPLTLPYGIVEAATAPACVPPTVTVQPNPPVVHAGDSVRFGVHATGDHLTYQWYFEDVLIPSATTASITLTNVQNLNSGTYRVSISNSCGTADSDAAALMVGAAIPLSDKIMAGPFHNPVNDHYYFLLKPATWTASEATAVQLGGHLASINDQAEQDWVYNTFAFYPGVSDALWIGFTDASHEGNWVWTSGEPNTFTYWSVMEPNNYWPGESFGVMFAPPDTRAPYWNDADNINSVGASGITLVNCYGVVELPVAPVKLTVLVNGLGKVTAPSLLYAKKGQTITMTATPYANNVFSNWVCNATNSSYSVAESRYSFIIAGEQTIIANFTSNRFLATAGNYCGLFNRTNAITPDSAGYFKGTVTSRRGLPGVMTGTLSLAGRTARFKGIFNPSGSIDIPVPLDTGTVTVHLQIPKDGSDTISGSVTNGNGGWRSPLNGDRNIFKVSSPTFYAGQYTLVLPGSSDSDSPTGDGYGSVKVSPAGTITIGGKLGDGALLKQSTTVSKRGDWPFFCSASTGTGSNAAIAMGWLSFSNGLNGAVAWVKGPLPGSPLYPGGLTNEADVLSSTYTKPAANQRAVNLNNGNGMLVLEGGNLSQCASNQVYLSAQNKVLAAAPATNVSLTINPNIGFLNGSYNQGKGGPSPKFYGVVLQEQNMGRGFVAGTNHTGIVQLQGN